MLHLYISDVVCYPVKNTVYVWIEAVVFHTQGEPVHFQHVVLFAVVADAAFLVGEYPHLYVGGDARVCDHHVVVVSEVFLQSSVVVSLHKIFVFLSIEVDADFVEVRCRAVEKRV